MFLNLITGAFWWRCNKQGSVWFSVLWKNTDLRPNLVVFELAMKVSKKVLSSARSTLTNTVKPCCKCDCVVVLLYSKSYSPCFDCQDWARLIHWNNQSGQGFWQWGVLPAHFMHRSRNLKQSLILSSQPLHCPPVPKIWNCICWMIFWIKRLSRVCMILTNEAHSSSLLAFKASNPSLLD